MTHTISRTYPLHTHLSHCSRCALLDFTFCVLCIWLSLQPSRLLQYPSSRVWYNKSAFTFCVLLCRCPTEAAPEVVQGVEARLSNEDAGRFMQRMAQVSGMARCVCVCARARVCV